MRRLLRIFAPSSRLDMLRKFLLFCSLVVAWNIVWSWYISGQAQRVLANLVFDALAVGGPFVAIFVLGSWHQVSAIDALKVRARIDPLSGVYNRQTFFSRLRRITQSSKTGMLLLIDADHFKRINDQYGHAVGDRCIEAIGHRLNWHLRNTDLAGRVGGEEFGVFLADVNHAHGLAVAARLGQPVSFSDAEKITHLSVSLSIGAVWTDPKASAEDQLVLADNALYEAKSSGRGSLVIHGENGSVPLSKVDISTYAEHRADDRRTPSRLGQT